MTGLPTHRVPLDGPPVREVPDWGARRALSWGTFDFVDRCSVESHFQLTDHVLAVNLAETQCEIAVESDRFQRVLVPPGGLSFHPAGTRTKVVAPDCGPYLAVTIARDRFADLLLEEFGIDGAGVRPVHGHFDRSAHAIASLAHNSFTGAAPLDRNGLEAAATLLTLHAIRPALVAPPPRPTGAAMPDLRRACDHIADHLDDPSLGTRSIAAALGLPPATLWRAFRDTFGMTLYEYIRRQRG